MLKQTMKDQEIIQLLRSGNTHLALRKLFVYQNTVVKHIKANSGSRQDAEDVFQEALIILCRKACDANFQLTSTLNTYIFGICKNLWRDELRKRSGDSAILPDHDFIDADDSLVNEQKYNLAEKALNAVSETCRSIFQLFYIEKISMISIAERLGLSSENAAKIQKYKCLEKAREQYVSFSSNPQNH
jgi:RNA polymerase sigma factor (sigma-70 family)